MANSIRTPKQGTSATSRKIAAAVDDEEWQKFRVSLKGKSTREKLDRLENYYYSTPSEPTADNDSDVVSIRVENYLKALARGGQIEPTLNYIADFLSDRLVIRK